MAKLSPAQRRLIRRKTRPPESDGTESDELNIIPFLDVVVNLIMFLLLTMTSILAAREVQAQLPSYGPPGTPEWSATIILTDDGATVSDGAGTVAPGCEDYGPGPTVARVGEETDWLALRACAERLKALHADSERVTIGADPNIPISHVIRAMDAVRGGQSELFPDVRLAAGVR